LPELQATAPPGLAEKVLAEAGLADWYAATDSPLGRIFIAWNGRGGSWGGTAEDPAEFEARVAAHTGRPIHRADALPRRLERAIDRRLAGDRRARIELDLRG